MGKNHIPKNQNEIKLTLRIDNSLIEECDQRRQKALCSNRTQFIEKALAFYIQYLDSDDHLDYIAPILTSIVHSAVRDCEERISRNVFKLAVEQAKFSHLTAAFHDVDDSVIRGLHHKCVNEVSQINGIMRFEDAYRYQHEK